MNAISHIIAECPSCRSSFRVSEEHIGKTAKCTSCGKAFVVERRETQKPSNLSEELPPQRVDVECRVCQTRLQGSIRQVGQWLTCPDCGTKTKLPPPERRRLTPPPASLEGEQYALWEGEDQPWGVDLAAAEAKMIPVHCGLCETLMYARPEQTGQMIDCPDCGYASLVKPLHEPETDAEDVTGDAYDLDEKNIAVASLSLPPSVQDLDSLSEEDRAQRVGRVVTDRRARPQMPRWPLLTGWYGFLLAPGVIARWISLSLVLAGVLALGVVSYATTMGAGSGLAAFGAVAGLCFLCLAAMAGILWYGAASACAIMVVTESSEGNNQIQPWPSSNPIDWLGEAFYLMVTFAAAAIPGWAVGTLAFSAPEDLATATALSIWLCFPVVLLSTLEASSPWALVMPGVLGSLRYFPGSWVLFYLMSGAGLMLAIGVLVTVEVLGLLGGIGGLGLLLAVPIVIAAVGLYFRLIGRLAWQIRE
ncbi:MAG: MJ0042-type zinc finger domain-containing protein [Aeoliella sp.]